MIWFMKKLKKFEHLVVTYFRSKSDRIIIMTVCKDVKDVQNIHEVYYVLILVLFDIFCIKE